MSTSSRRVCVRAVERDAPVAAAISHGMTVVTRDVAGFEATGVRLVNLWAESR